MPVTTRSKKNPPAPTAPPAPNTSRKRHQDESDAPALPDSARVKRVLPLVSTSMASISLANVRATDKPGVLMLYTTNGKLKFFKPHLDGRRAQLEAYCAAYTRMLVGTQSVPSMKTCYTGGVVQGVVSSAMAYFMPNSLDPLAVSERYTATERNYNEMVAGLARMLVASLLTREGDLTNNNFSKRGQKVDFGENHQSVVKIISGPYVNPLREELVESYQLTENDIRTFPVLRDARIFRWPTNRPIDWLRFYLGIQIKIALENNPDSIKSTLREIVLTAIGMVTVMAGMQSDSLIMRLINVDDIVDQIVERESARDPDIMADIIANVLNRMTESLGVKPAFEALVSILTSNNTFSTMDNCAYELLAKNGAFKHAKFETLLKFMLLDWEVISALAGLYVAPACEVIRNDEQMSLIQAIIAEDMARLDEVKRVLSPMPEFRAFLEERNFSDDPLASIKAELATFSAQYKAKLAKKPYYDKLLDALHPDKLDARYQALCRDLLGYECKPRAQRYRR